MSFDNTVAVISNNVKITEFITSKLVLLRNVDKVEHANTIEAFDCVKEKKPNVIVLYAEFDDNKKLQIVKKIRAEKDLKNIPIILIAQKCTPEFLVEMFDAGISDIISSPIKEHELLFRIMWNIQKSEEKVHLSLQEKFLANLGIIQLSTGFYTKKYSEEFLTNQVEYALEHKEQACVMLLKIKNSDSDNDLDEFSKIIKKSIRINDLVGIRDVNEYYIFLPKTKLNGAYAVFERLKKNAGLNYKINASVIDVLDRTFDKIKENLENALGSSQDAESFLVVASDAININGVKIFKKTSGVIDDELINKAFSAVLEKNQTTATNQNKKSTKNKLKTKIEKKKQEVLNENVQEQRILDNISKTPDEIENMQIAQRNAVVFKQVYKNKCLIVIEPAFKKYKNLIKDANKYVFAEYKVSPVHSYFKAIKGANEILINLKYEGLATIQVETVHIFNNRINSKDAVDVEITRINKQLLEDILKEFTNALESC